MSHSVDHVEAIANWDEFLRTASDKLQHLRSTT